ncbi:Disease resistance RPP8-like protein 3 [Camellia lanceoleosa]|uniref:Disease resistance RPP8-like protein 3 n=1 Tax=Camellia lanceoleosa TaxID=1840588 RepID=A0ACC0FGP6_9ERIC|nr:Disease resistance RPP8-like protein 3 [Camellia lanceoleosa]
MAEFIIPAVVRKAIEIGSNLIIQAVPHHVREHVDWIQQEMTYIQSFLEDADGKQGDKRVAAFLLDIRDLGLEVEDILDKYFPKIVSSKRKGFFGIFGSSSTTHKFVAEIEALKRRVEDIKSRRLVYGIQEKNVTDEGVTCYSRRRSFPHYDEPNVVGFEEHINSLVGKLLDKNSQSSVISITGMAGLGKTTLAKKVYNSVLRSFECSAWICVSQQPNTDQLLRDIARQVGLGKEKRENDIEANLFAFLYYKREEDWKELEKKHFKNVVGELRYLRVVRLQCGRQECRGLKISLPSEIGNLGHLSYIRLIGASGCTIKLPSSIVNIKSLLTLDFRRSGGKFTIPDCIWKMKHLKHIFLPVHYEIKSDLRGILLDKVKFLHPVEASLNLQTLYGLKFQRRPIKHRFPKFTSLRKLGVSFEGCDSSNIKVLLDAITASHKLDTLRLLSGLDVGELHSFNIQDLNLFRFENLSRLHLRGALPELQQHVSLFPPNLTKLTLKFTFLKENPMETLKKLPKLKILKLDSNSYIGQNMVCSGRRGIDDNFPQLQVLEVFNLPFLVELILEKEVMPQLKKLRISNFRFEGVIKLPKRIRDISIINESKESRPLVFETDL